MSKKVLCLVLSLLVVLLFSSAIFAAGWGDTIPNGVKGPWGNYAKCVHGNDGGKWLKDFSNEGSWEAVRTLLNDTLPEGDTRSIMKPVGDGSWYIKLKYTPGYTINSLKIVYTDKADSMNGNSWWYNDGHWVYTVNNITVPTNAVGSCTFGLNWGDTPLALDTGWGLNTYPDSGKLTLKWKTIAAKGSASLSGGQTDIANFGDVDSADSSSQYGYKLFRATNPAGPFTQTGPIFITREYIDPQDGTLMSFLDTGLTNGETYYYIVRAIDAYGSMGDSSTGLWSGVPNAYIDVYFKVEGADMNVIEKNDGVVYLTPYVNDKPLFFQKIRAKMVWGTPRENL